MPVSPHWPDWPSLPDLFPASFPGVTTSRDPFLVDVNLDQLEARVKDYFDVDLEHEEVASLYPVIMRTNRRFAARSVRDTLVRRGGPTREGFIRYAYRPFDTRWLYWDADTDLLDRKRPEYKPHVLDRNLWLCSAQHLRKGETEPQAYFTRSMASYHLIERGALWFPAWLREEGLGVEGEEIQYRPNLSPHAETYLERIGADVEDLFHHVLAVLHDPVYREANAGALRMEWPRIPLPGGPDGDNKEDAAELTESAARGREIAVLLDSDSPVPGVTAGPLRPEVATVAVPSTLDGSNMDGQDFELSAGWGHFGSGQAVMPGLGRVEERPYTSDERAVVGDDVAILGETTFDIYLNGRAYWKNVPSAVWNYKLGGYQVLKKWLSYRESRVLGRALRPEEIQHFTDTARRVAALLTLTSR